MPRQAKNPGSRPGRRTKAEELREAFEATGSDMAKLEEFLGGALQPDEPGEMPSAQKIRDELQRLLYERRGELKGIALVQGLKALAALAETEQQKDEQDNPDDDRQPLLDRLDALPPEHATALVKQEIARTDSYRDELFAALERLEAT